MPLSRGIVPTLLHVPWHRSSMPYQLAIELKIPASELVVKEMTIDELRNEPGIEKVSPRRVVPALAISAGHSILESGAIMMFMLEHYDVNKRLHPSPHDVRRPLFLQGMFYASNAYHALRLLIIHSDGEGDEQRAKLEVAIAECKRVMVDHLHWVLDAGRSTYYVGNEFSAVDIMFGYLFMCWEQCYPVDYGSQTVKKYVDRLKQRASYQFLYCDGGVSEEDQRVRRGVDRNGDPEGSPRSEQATDKPQSRCMG